VENTRVIAKHSGDDIDSWMVSVAPDLPLVSYPQLADALYRNLDPGVYLSQPYADQMAFVYAEVDRLDAAARTCRRFPDRAQAQAAPQIPNVQQPQFPQGQPIQPQVPQVPEFPRGQPIRPHDPEIPQLMPVPPQTVFLPPQPVPVQPAPKRFCPLCPLCPLGFLSDLFAPRQPQYTYRRDLAGGAFPQIPVTAAPSKFTGSNHFPTTGAISY
jgi:hypothetical protein